MARNPPLRARFFAPAKGPAVPKARALTHRQRRRILDRDGWSCQYCGARLRWLRVTLRFTLDETRPANVDHIFPRARGGQNTDDNLISACERCNLGKAAD